MKRIFLELHSVGIKPMSKYNLLDPIIMSPFARRQTPESQFSHFTGSEAQLIELVEANFLNAKPGYRKDEGVLCVPVPASWFYSGIVQLEDGDRLLGVFRKRPSDKEPRKSLYAKSGEKMPAQYVEVILYHSDVLRETASEEEMFYCPRASWVIISINGSPTKEPVPVEPITMMYNHFKLDGGTDTQMTNDEFVSALYVSLMFWKDKALSKGQG